MSNEDTSLQRRPSGCPDRILEVIINMTEVKTHIFALNNSEFAVDCVFSSLLFLLCLICTVTVSAFCPFLLIQNISATTCSICKFLMYLMSFTIFLTFLFSYVSFCLLFCLPIYLYLSYDFFILHVFLHPFVSLDIFLHFYVFLYITLVF